MLIENQGKPGKSQGKVREFRVKNLAVILIHDPDTISFSFVPPIMTKVPIKFRSKRMGAV